MSRSPHAAKSRVGRKTSASMFPLVEKYLASELSQKAFCDQHNLPTAVFSYWLKKYRKAHRSAPSARNRSAHGAFVPVRVIPPGHPAPCTCELVFPNGVTLRFSQPVEPNLLIQLIRNGA